MSVTKKQRAFVEEYLKCWNATRAAIAAGYSERSASTIAHRLLDCPHVKDAIRERVAQKAMSADEVLLRLADQAVSSMEDFLKVGEDGFVIDLEKARLSGKLHLIKAITPTRDGYRIELHDQQKALELLGKAHGLFKEVTEHRDAIPIRIIEVNAPDGEQQ